MNGNERLRRNAGTLGPKQPSRSASERPRPSALQEYTRSRSSEAALCEAGARFPARPSPSLRLPDEGRVADPARPSAESRAQAANAGRRPARLSVAASCRSTKSGELPPPKLSRATARRPVPLAVHGEAPERLLASQLLQRVHQQVLAEPARTRQEIVLTPSRRGGAHGPSCRRSSSPAPGFSGGMSSRSEASVSSEGRPQCPSRKGRRPPARSSRADASRRAVGAQGGDPAETTAVPDEGHGDLRRGPPTPFAEAPPARDGSRLQTVSNSNPTMLRSSRPNSMPIR